MTSLRPPTSLIPSLLLLQAVFFLSSSTWDFASATHHPHHFPVPQEGRLPPGTPTMPITAPPPRSKTVSTPPATPAIVNACAQARYPSLCVRTLSSSPMPTTTPADLARAAVSASLSSAHDAHTFLSTLPPPTSGSVSDCKEQLSTSADQLKKTMFELSKLRPETFRWQMDNALTWASAALTNTDTCLDAVQQRAATAPPPSLKDAVVGKVSRVSRTTSNALYLINCLAATHGRWI